MSHKQPVPMRTSSTEEPVKVLVPRKNKPNEFKAKPKKLEDGTVEMIHRAWLMCPRCYQTVELTPEMGKQIGDAIKALDEKDAQAKQALGEKKAEETTNEQPATPTKKRVKKQATA